MSLEWTGEPPRAERERRQYEIRELDNGNFGLFRRIAFNNGRWSKWGFCGEYESLEEAQRPAEEGY